jgi:hypothetical protein
MKGGSLLYFTEKCGKVTQKSVWVN